MAGWPGPSVEGGAEEGVLVRGHGFSVLAGCPCLLLRAVEYLDAGLLGGGLAVGVCWLPADHNFRGAVVTLYGAGLRGQRLVELLRLRRCCGGAMGCGAEPCERDDYYLDPLGQYEGAGAKAVLHGLAPGGICSKLGHGRKRPGGWVPCLDRACRHVMTDCLCCVGCDGVRGEVAANGEPLEVVAEIGMCQLYGSAVGSGVWFVLGSG